MSSLFRPAGYKRVGVARGEVVGRHVDDVFEDDTVDHPQRFRGTVDAGGTTHANLRRSTKGAADVLYRHTGGTALERSADVGHAVNLRVGGVHLRRRAGESALVHLLHARHHHLFYHHALGSLQHHAHALTGRHGLRLHAHVAHHELLALSHGYAEATVDVGHGGGRRTLHFYRRTDGWLTVGFDNCS